MSASEYEEHALARRMEFVLQRGIEDKTIRQRMWAIRQLPTLPEVKKQVRQTDLLDQLHSWMDAHQGLRPRLNIYRQGGRVPVSEMTPLEKEEYTLAQRLANALNKGIEDTQVRRELGHINTLPLYNPPAEP